MDSLEKPSKGSKSGTATLDEWIQSRFAKRECIRVVPVSKDSSKCCCGRHLALHYYFEGEEDSADNDAGGDKTNWSVERCTASYPTDAHGTLTFRAGKGSRKYVRADLNVDPSDLWRLLVDVWGLEPPTLVITIQDGYEEQSSLSPSFIKAFKKGLTKAARTASTWIITSGLRSGITEYVTAAFNDTSSCRNSKLRRVHVIGFAPWGLVRGANQLVTGVSGEDVLYSGYVQHADDKMYRSTAGNLLSEGHSGFVLVDDGTVDQLSPTTDSVRRLFESFLRSLPMRRAGGRCIPVVCLMVGGKRAALDAFFDYVSNEPFAPVVACAGSGGVADWIATIYEKSNDIEPISGMPIHRRFLRHIQSILCLDKSEATKLVATLRNLVLTQQNYITIYRVFDADHGSADLVPEGLPEENQLDVAMLNALLKGLPLCAMEKLNLTVTWDREDLAREILEEAGGVGLEWPDVSLDEAMMNALMYDRVDFVHLLLSNGLAMDRFLTIPRLEQLYNSDSGPPNILRFILRDVTKNANANYKYKLQHIGLIIEKLMGFGYRSTYCRREFLRRYKYESLRRKSTATGAEVSGRQRKSTVTFVEDNFPIGSPRRPSIFTPYRNRPHFAYPYHELFVWAVLTNRKQLAKCFWQNGQEHLAKALIGGRLYESLAKEAEHDYLEMDICQHFEEIAKEFKMLACELLAQCYESDDAMTLQLLTYELRQFSKSTCISLAANCRNETFVAHQSCQLLLADLWLGGLRLRKNINVKVLAGILFPPVISFLTFKTKEELQLQAQTAEESQVYCNSEEDRRMSWQDDTSFSSDSDIDGETIGEEMTFAEDEPPLDVRSAPILASNQNHVTLTETTFSTPLAPLSVRFAPSIEKNLGQQNRNQRKRSEPLTLDGSLPMIPTSINGNESQITTVSHMDTSRDAATGSPFRKLPKPFRRFATAADLGVTRLNAQLLLDRPPVFTVKRKQRQQLDISRKILEFYSAPVCSFWSFTVGYVIFLSFFTYVVLVKTPLIPDWPEYYVIAFFATYLADQIRKILVKEPRRLKAKLKVYASSVWDSCSTVACVCFFLALVLRLNPRTLTVGRVLYCVNIVFWYARVLRLMSINSALNPYINMYGKMVVQLLLLSTILFVMLASFGVLRQSITYPNEDWQWALLRDVCYKPYSMLYGSLYPEEITECQDNGKNCAPGVWLTPLFMTLYLLLAIVVFMNMMVAAFSHIFNEVNDRAQEIAKFDSYSQVMEFEQQPFLPPPLVVFSHVYIIGKYLYKRFCKKQKHYHLEHSLKLFLTPDEKEKLHEFERDCLTELLAKKAEKKANCLESRLQYFSDRLDAMTSQVDYLHEQDKSHRLALLKFEKFFAPDIRKSDTSLNNTASSLGVPQSPVRSLSELGSLSRKSEPAIKTTSSSHFPNGHTSSNHDKPPQSPSRMKEEIRKTPKQPRVRLLSEYGSTNGETDAVRSRSGSAPPTPTWSGPGKSSPTGVTISRKYGQCKRDSLQ